MKKLAMVMAAGALACSARPRAVQPHPLARATAQSPASASPATSVAPALATEVVPEAPLTLQEALCGKVERCQVTRTLPATHGQNGEVRLVAVTVEPATSDIPCALESAWLVHLREDGTVLRHQLAGMGCAEDTPYGVACDGLSKLKVQLLEPAAPSTALVEWEGPGPGCGGWTRASGGIEVSLETFAVLRRTEWTGRVRDPASSVSKLWDFAQLSFKSEWQSGVDGMCPNVRRLAWGVPRIQLAPAFLAGAWQDASLEGCAGTIDARHGAALPGRRKSTASLRVVLSDAEALFVDVIEPPTAKPGGALEVCFAEWNSQDVAYCQLGLLPACARIALDGRVLKGNVEVARAKDKLRFRIQLPPDMGALSVSYQEANGSSISSSAYRPADPTSLGRVVRIAATLATCKLEAGHLRFAAQPLRAAQNLLDPEGLE